MMIGVLVLAAVLTGEGVGPTGEAHMRTVSYASAASSTGGPHRRLVIGGDCQGCDFAAQNLAGARIEDGRFQGANFSDAAMMEARFNDVNLTGVNMSDVQLSQARFNDVNFTGAHLRGTRFANAVFVHVDLSGSNLDETFFVGGVLRHVRANNASIRSAQWINTSVEHGEFQRSDLRESDMTGFRADTIDFTQSDMRGVNLTGARFANVDFTDADLRDVVGFEHAEFINVCATDKFSILRRYVDESCNRQTVDTQHDHETESPEHEQETHRNHDIRVYVREERLRTLEAEREQIRIARLAFEEALRNLEQTEFSPRRGGSETLDAARHGVQDAAEALADAEIDLNARLEAARQNAIEESEWESELEFVQSRERNSHKIEPPTYIIPPAPPVPASEVPPLPELRAEESNQDIAAQIRQMVRERTRQVREQAAQSAQRSREQAREDARLSREAAREAAGEARAAIVEQRRQETAQRLRENAPLRMNMGGVQMFATEDGFEMRAGDVVMQFDSEGGFIREGDNEFLSITPPAPPNNSEAPEVPEVPERPEPRP
ncbi:pentapeptide repeat-containing protein [Woodsholea maritima]|uniref:pentapeptide repeat-containing protein n=1 Tax=Woodsholea maritima TaxID=240237 RepID=UPI00037E7DC1|nr:pentapeptide repeat-containing protein [Woodsholea maritima]